MPGPLDGVTVIEMAGLGPAPFCAMMLSDMGAEVIRIDPKQSKGPIGFAEARFDVTSRGRRSVALDLKKPGADEAVLRLIERADVLLEGFRPGVMERLGLGPEVCLLRRPRLVYARMTGWGQSGPLAQAAGHDINYIAISGALRAMGRPHEPPVPPLNLVGDYGGGAMLMAFGIVCALLETKRSGNGQVVDAAMCDGAALLSSLFYGFHAAGIFGDHRGQNFLDGSAHFYDTYACADGKYVAVGALESPFFKVFCEKIGLDLPDMRRHLDPKAWPELKAKIATILLTKNREAWCQMLEGTDACFTPVLDWTEAPRHAHHMARQGFVEVEGVVQPAPAPRFSHTPGRVQGPVPKMGEHTAAVLKDFGFSLDEVDRLTGEGVL